MTEIRQLLLALWAKTSRDNSWPDAYHPALFHMLDVGHVAQLLLSPNGSSRMRSAVARALGVADADSLISWFPIVIALHDLGKISSPFQGQVDTHRMRLESLGFAFARSPRPIRHQHISAIAVRDEILPAISALAPYSALIIDTLAGHHGEYPDATTMRAVRLFNTHNEAPEWREHRSVAVRELLDVFPLPDHLSLAPVPNLRAATAALTGFTILCDWLGSDEQYFRLEPERSLTEYLPLSRARAQDAINSAGFGESRPQATWGGFKRLFPDIEHPRPLQRTIDELTDKEIVWPALIIIEAPTGEGKTETALALARRLAASGGSDELYVALPTMATSNQMYQRVLRFLHDNLHQSSPVNLVHGQAFLVEHDLRVSAFGDGTDPESPAAAVPAWFAPRKRALLAPHGVGTVDQAELAVLNARHYMLRLFGLTGKVVIIDEVHAYDTYMNTVIDHALWWLATLGTPVILLSATLPVARHRQLARAYCRGLIGELPDSGADGGLPDLSYPSVAIYTQHGTRTLSPDAYQPARSLTLRFVADLSPVDDARRLLDLVRNGGAICRITNTVRRAQEIYAALRDLTDDDIEQHLLHARLPGEDRLQREAVVAERLGPRSRRSSVDRIIVVGTQVLEQSLDYDVDLMVTDLAPIDLLLQRAGRLHRHQHRRPDDRPDTMREPVLEVVVGTVEHALPDLGVSRYVYEPFILWKSWLALCSRQHGADEVRLTLPADYRPMIEAAYDERIDTVPQDHPEWSRLEQAWSLWQSRKARMEDAARQRIIPFPDPLTSITEGAHIRFEEDEDGGRQGWGFAATRFGQETISVIPLHRVADGVAIEPDERPLSMDAPTRAAQLRLLRRSISVSQRDIVQTLPFMEHLELPWWDDLPLLRYHHPLLLDQGALTVGSTSVRLDPELGLMYGEEDDV